MSRVQPNMTNISRRHGIAGPSSRSHMLQDLVRTEGGCEGVREEVFYKYQPLIKKISIILKKQ